jgi:hypothetical protein
VIRPRQPAAHFVFRISWRVTPSYSAAPHEMLSDSAVICDLGRRAASWLLSSSLQHDVAARLRTCELTLSRNQRGHEAVATEIEAILCGGQNLVTDEVKTNLLGNLTVDIEGRHRITRLGTQLHISGERRSVTYRCTGVSVPLTWPGRNLLSGASEGQILGHQP